MVNCNRNSFFYHMDGTMSFYKKSDMGAPDKPHCSVELIGYAEECSERCALFKYPEKCVKSTCNKVRKNKEIKVKS